MTQIDVRSRSLTGIGKSMTVAWEDWTATDNYITLTLCSQSVLVTNFLFLVATYERVYGGCKCSIGALIEF